MADMHSYILLKAAATVDDVRTVICWHGACFYDGIPCAEVNIRAGEWRGVGREMDLCCARNARPWLPIGFVMVCFYKLGVIIARGAHATRRSYGDTNIGRSPTFVSKVSQKSKNKN